MVIHLHQELNPVHLPAASGNFTLEGVPKANLEIGYSIINNFAVSIALLATLALVTEVAANLLVVTAKSLILQW